MSFDWVLKVIAYLLANIANDEF